ncbi:MAG: hypothetical protein LV480_03945 [Methylacidiphilales bacterium]|nr:hypothetical protein [Candidatus Methylacidiphilales bacterium]
MSDKTTMPCPACREAGKDTDGDNLRIFPSRKFHCIAAGKDKSHNRRIIELMPELGSKDSLPSSGPFVARPIPKPKRLDLLARIKADFPATVADLWEASPARCDEDLDETRAFLRLFPHDGLLWIAPDIYQTGKPEHTLCWRTRTEWERETFTAPGMRIAPSSFRQGTISRKAKNVIQHLFVVIESDLIGDGKLYSSKDEFCSLIRWLREACGWQLAAVVDSGRRSLHAWFRHPGDVDMTQLAEHDAALGLDSKFSEPSQPWRLPGVKREGSGTRQSLVYLERTL